MPKFTCHLFVCCNQRSDGHPRGCCDPAGNEELREKLKSAAAARKLSPAVRVNKAGCLDQCELGPCLVLYPQEIWYGHVTAADVDRILDETVIGGRVIPELLIPDEQLNNPLLRKK
ncbi:MAG: (2Fe-2S) ferredoxin domain-containing protein [Pirellulales bacterium]|nr:(2Fe-2S) ferredoxin domain-containing protein [Pirellulales bacterium]